VALDAAVLITAPGGPRGHLCARGQCGIIELNGNRLQQFPDSASFVEIVR